MNDNMIVDVLPSAGRSIQDKNLERQFRVACKKLELDPKKTLQDYMKQVIRASEEKDRRINGIIKKY